MVIHKKLYSIKMRGKLFIFAFKLYICQKCGFSVLVLPSSGSYGDFGIFPNRNNKKY